MKLHTAKRIYTTKISILLLRPVLNENQPFEFMQRMSDSEIAIFLSEIRDQLKTEGILNNDSGYYDKMHNALIKDREDVYQVIKKCGDDGNFDYNKDSKKFLNFSDLQKKPYGKRRLYIWEKEYNKKIKQ